MVNFRSKTRLVLILLSFIITSGILALELIYFLSDHFSKTTRTKANILLVEGWLPPYAIEMAYEEFNENGYSQIITTGIKSPEFYAMSMNGYLIFYPEKMTYPDNQKPIHVIDVDAYSELGGKNSALFNVFINDSLVADFSAEKRRKKYSVKWEGRLTDIDSVMVQFINDGVGDYGDRNLYVKSITIDKIIIPYQNYSEYDISKLDGKNRIVNNFTSFAQLARNRFLSLGIDSSLIIAVPGKQVRFNRTLESALAFRNWLKTSDIEINGINIVSVGTHAKRTMMTYNKILDGKYNIGIISLPDYKERFSRRYKVLRTLRETLGITYYWFILLPY